MTLRIGVPREIKPGENRVAITPEGVRALRAAGAAVRVETGAGAASGFADGEYASAGAEVAASAAQAWDADLVVKVKEPVAAEFPFLCERTALFAYLHLAAAPDLARALVERRVTAIAYETVSDGEGLPLLRPMSEIAGILAVQAGARGLEAGFGGRGILLGGVSGVPPADVVVLGAGTAGSSAARAAAAAGAAVTVLDVSDGKLRALCAAAGGRIRAVRSAPEAIAEASASADLLISTVLVVGDRAPRLVTREMVRGMRRGAVAVDVAIDQGGSIETSRPTTHSDPFYIEEGVVHYCVTNMPAAVPRTSTLALTRATLPYLLDIAKTGVEGALRGNASLRAGLNTCRGRVTCAGAARALRMPHAEAAAVLSCFGQ